MGAMQYSPMISELEPKSEIEGAFLVKYLSIQTDKKGKPYLNLILMDSSGEIESRVWENAPQVFDQVRAKDIIRVNAHVNIFQGKKQLILNAVERAAPDSYPLDRFIPCSHFDRNRMYEDLLEILRNLKDPFAVKLALSIVEDPAIKNKICSAPAAKTIHHAYAGGLLEHVLSICRMMNMIGPHYQNYYGKAINVDLLILGSLLHDIGKIEELSWERGTEYTDSGKLIGHLVQGVELVNRYIEKIPDFPADLALQIKHLIVSHHGRLEYGSPKVPATVEALIVHEMDNLDSKINEIFTFMKRDETPGNWTSFSKTMARVFQRPSVAPKIQGKSPGVTN